MSSTARIVVHPPLTGRVAVVTGASAGIGEAVAHRLHSAGASVLINARRAPRLDDVAKVLGGDGGLENEGRRERVRMVVGDCADPAVIGDMLDDAKRGFGQDPDLVVVNAGRGLNGSVMGSDESQWEDVIRTNILGAARLIRAAGERMLKRVPANECGQAGAWVETPRDIVVIGSVVGRHVSPFSSLYGATKFAVHAMTEGVRRELAPRGVRVTLIEPGFVVSEFQQVAGYADAWFETMKEKFAPMLTPPDIARMIEFVVSQPAHVHVSDLLVRPTRQEYP